MTFLSRLFGSPLQLPPREKQRAEQWHALRKPDLRTAFEASRYVIVDVETSGLNPKQDSLIAIGAVAVEKGRIMLNDAFEVVLRQTTSSSADNILIHGIGNQDQTAGREPADALLDFLEFVGQSPLVAFHAAFDSAVLRRAIELHLAVDFRLPWLDLALLAPALMPKLATRLLSLDDWTLHFNIGNFARHSALADAYCTAQLLLALIEIAKRSGNAKCFADLADLEKTQRTLLRLRE